MVSTDREVLCSALLERGPDCGSNTGRGTMVNSRAMGYRRASWTWLYGLVLVHGLAHPAAAQRAPAEDRWREARERLVATWLVPAGISDSATLVAMGTVPRHEFVPAEYRSLAYEDLPLPIGQEQTISLPAVVALMTQLIRPVRAKIGTGSGYQAAVLAEAVAGSGPSRSSGHWRKRHGHG